MSLLDLFKAQRPWRRILVLAVVLLLIASVVLVRSSIFNTDDGAIIVSSPQVYTRERLVNDRYDQAHWLATQMHDLDASGDLLTGEVVEEKSYSANAGVTIPSSAVYGAILKLLGANASNGNQSDTATSKDVGAAVPQKSSDTEVPKQNAVSPEPSPVTPSDRGDRHLPFDLQFLIRNSIRDSIRELALENALDDRHDLRGNSIYGLKFDTTVIPRSGRDTAIVDVSLGLGDLSNLSDNSNVVSTANWTLISLRSASMNEATANCFCLI